MTQLQALDILKMGELVFLTGNAGSGKTYVLNQFINYLHKQNIPVGVTASTGIAATHLNGTTIHSWSGIKLAKGLKTKIIHSVLGNKPAVTNWKKVRVLIVDEISMMSAKIMEILEEIARHVRRNPAVFGGIQVIFTGDFYQLPPIGDPNEPLTCQFCFQSMKWREIFPKKHNLILLKTIFRQKDPLYANILNQIRVGELTEENALVLFDRINTDPYSDNADGDIISRLYPIKNKVDIINKHNFEKIVDKEYQQNIFVKTNCKMYLDTGLPIVGEILEKCLLMTPMEMDFETKRLLSNIPTDETVFMKKGAIVMLTFNLSVEDGLCNGSQGIIVDILENQIIKENAWLFSEPMTLPVVRFTNGLTRRIMPQFWQSDEFPRICVGQFPLILAWALTIHKIQGASLDRAIIDAGSSIFEYGQTYVALSRIRSLEGLYLSNFHPERIKAHPLVKEFYKNVRNYIPESEFDHELFIESPPVLVDTPIIENLETTDFTSFAYQPQNTIDNINTTVNDDVVENNDANIPIATAIYIPESTSHYVRVNKLP